MMKKCRLTILKTTLNEDLAREYGVKGLSACPLMKEGQVFISDYGKPDGFCDEAWKAVYQYVFCSLQQCRWVVLRRLDGYEKTSWHGHRLLQ